MDLGNGLGHLTYSTLVHPGDTWAEMRESLERHLPAVKARVSPDAPFGVSLRLSADAAQTLTDDADERAWLRGFLDEQGLYVYTVNAFPYGPFKGGDVMERVYAPDWTTQERLTYTCQVADLLAEIAAPGVSPSIQTAPLAFAADVDGPAYVARFTTRLLQAVAHLVDLERRTGRRVKLALEPEPACYLETTAETVAYFTGTLYPPSGIAELAALAGVPLSEAEGLLRRHLGVVFDIGHQSVGFEDVRASVEALTDAGIPVFKLQEAAALRVDELTPALSARLRGFTDTIYLSQTTLRRGEDEQHFLHLRDALDAYDATASDPGAGEVRLRTHFHVPVFLAELGDVGTTRSGVQDVLALHRETPVSDHLEIETYTWDVLPADLKDGDITDYVVRELEFVRGELLD